jgi:hypothetical protein
MSTLLTIIVSNAQAVPNNIFFFQQPAQYVGGPIVYSNSLYSTSLAPQASGAQAVFQSNLQFYAGVQQASAGIPAIGAASGYTSAAQPISLTTSGATTANSTSMIASPLSLSVPGYTAGVQPGSFRIITPVYSSPPNYFNVGSATLSNGLIVLSNFVLGQPNQNTDCQPILKYYVALGNYTSGQVMNFTQSSVTAALCDFTTGFTQAQVTLNSNGTWSSPIMN